MDEALVAPVVCIDAQNVALLSTEELIDGNAELFSLDVPQRLLQRAGRSIEDRAAALAPKGVVIKIVPDVVDVAGVFAKDEVLCQIGDHCAGGVATDAKAHRALADTGDALVGDKFHDRGTEAASLDNVYVYFYNLHKKLLAFRC